MKKISKIILFLSLSLIPIIVFASVEDNLKMIPGLLLVPAISSVHMTIFVLTPIAQLVSGPEKYKDTVKILFAFRILILLYGFIYYGSEMVFIDFIAIFVGTLLVSLLSGIKKLKLR